MSNTNIRIKCDSEEEMKAVLKKIDEETSFTWFDGNRLIDVGSIPDPEQYPVYIHAYLNDEYVTWSQYKLEDKNTDYFDNTAKEYLKAKLIATQVTNLTTALGNETDSSTVTAVSNAATNADMATEFDPVNRPEHYANTKVECIDAMEQIFGKEAVITFATLNMWKYLWRRKDKGNEEQDTLKALWYFDRAKELINR